MSNIIKINGDMINIHNNEQGYYVDYNGQAYLEATREALLARLRKNFEVIEYLDAAPSSAQDLYTTSPSLHMVPPISS